MYIVHTMQLTKLNIFYHLKYTTYLKFQYVVYLTAIIFQHFFDKGGKVSKVWVFKIQHRLLFFIQSLSQIQSRNSNRLYF